MKNQKYPKGISYWNNSGRNLKWCYERRIDGKRYRTFFSSLDLALRAKREAEESAKTGADLRLVFGSAEQKEYLAAKQICGSASLVEVALFWKKHENLRSARSSTVKNLVKEILESNERRGISDVSIRKHRLYLSKLVEKFGNRDVSTLSGRELTEWIVSFGLARQTNTTFRAVLGYAFNFARSAQYLAEVPEIDASLFPKETPKPVITLTTEEAKTILRTVRDKFPQYLPNIVLRMFCGLRTAEAARMRWEWIDEKQKRIVVPAEICKTRDDWVLQAPLLPETVFKWLAIVPDDSKVGLLPSTASTAIPDALPFEWKKNALRHTFCTMHISAEFSAEKTALLLRHRGASMMYRHYLAKLVSQEEAQNFFKITPESI